VKIAAAGAGFLALGIAAGAGALAAATQTTRPPAGVRNDPASLIDFQAQIRPVLSEHCLECHSQDKRKGGLSLATYADALEGGRNGAVIRPGNSGRSLLIGRVTGVVEPQMPKDEPPLSPAELALVRLWIDQGARESRTSAPAPPPWEAPLALERPDVPQVTWAKWSAPVDRFVSAYLREQGHGEPATVPDALFARRVYLDTQGLLPTPSQLDAFVADRNPSKREVLVATLLADNQKYRDHWISFWNDLLRNEDGVTYFSESAGRKSITEWLSSALESNLPYDKFVEKLINPSAPGDPDGFLVGVNWRGETSAAVTPWMQASQNTAQVFLGVNLKCNSCHDSFVSKWKLKDAYALAAYFAPDPKLQMFRCDVALDRYAEPGFLFPQPGHVPSSGSLADRRAAAAALFTDRRIGRLPRTLVNRVWQRLLGRGIVANPDEMDGKPWSPALLDWLASDFVEHGYDIKHLIATILVSDSYQMPSVARTGELPARGYVFAGPEVRRMSAEQFGDAIGTITGEWNIYPGRVAAAASGAPPAPGVPLPSMPPTAGVYGREWRVASSNLTRALGRPIRDQVIPVRSAQASTLQALELVNGEILTRWLSRGARRMLGETPPETLSLYNRTVAGRGAKPAPFVVDISKATRLWLVVQENGSNMPRALQPAWAQAELVGPAGVVPLSTLTPVDASGLRNGTGAINVAGSNGAGIRVQNPSLVTYDIAGKGFTTFRGIIGLENPPAEIGSTLDPQIRFFVFGAPPDMDRLIPPAPDLPLPAGPVVTTAADAIDRVFHHALGRAPSAAERQAAEAALRDPSRGTRPSPEGLADLLWAVAMKPEFQLIY
jgi:mono/diheme cytochrome c family protein